MSQDPSISSILPIHQIGQDGGGFWIGQVEEIYKAREHPPSKTNSSSISNEYRLMNSYFSKRENSVDKYCKEIAR